MTSVEVVFSPVVESIAGVVVMIDEDADRDSGSVVSKRVARETDFGVVVS